MKSAIFSIVLLLLLSTNLSAADACGASEYSATLNSTTTVYTNTATLHSSNTASYETDTYYVNVTQPGILSVTITNIYNGRIGTMYSSYSESSCPTNSGGSASYDISVSSAKDYNLRVYPVYRSDVTNADYEYQITITFSPSSTTPSGSLDGEREFSLRYGGHSTHVYGDIAATGGPVFCQDNGSGGCNWNYTGYLFDLNPVVVKDDNTFSLNSSTAALNLPGDINGSDILWAGLYWQGHVFGRDNATGVATARAGYDQVVMVDPQGERHTIVSTQNDYYGYDGQYVSGAYDGHRFFYQSFADVTNIVRNSMTTTDRTFTVGEITATSTKDTYYINDTKLSTTVKWGNWGGWNLLVVYQGDPNLYVLKNIAAYDGFKFLIPTFGGTTSSMTIDLPDNSFYTPPTGTVNSRLTVFAAGAEKAIAKDNLELWNDLNSDGTVNLNEWQPVYNSLNPYVNPDYNQFNDSITYLGSHLNTTRIFNPGIDIDTFDTTDMINNAQSTTKIRASMTSNNNSSDQTFIGSLALSVEMYTPRVCYMQSFTDDNGTALSSTNLPSIDDNISVMLTIKNTGSEVAEKVRIYRTFDDTITYNENTTNYSNIDASGTALPEVEGDDAPLDGDLVEYNATNTEWTMYVGRNAADDTGGDIYPESSGEDPILINYTVSLKDLTPNDIEYSVAYTIPYLAVDPDKVEPLPKCEDFNNTIFGQAPPFIPATVDVVDKFNSTASYNSTMTPSDKYIGTKIAGKSGYTFDAVHLADDGTTAEAYPSTRKIGLTVLIKLANDECTADYPFQNISETIATIEPGDTSATAMDSVTMPAYANQKMRVTAYAMDWESHTMTYGGYNNCQHQSSLEGSLCGVPSCLGSASNAIDAFPLNTGNTTIDSNHARILEDCYGVYDPVTKAFGGTIPDSSPCNVNNYLGSCGGLNPNQNISPAQYATTYGCLACILDISGGDCSSDNFAIRPDIFSLSTTNTAFPLYLRAGEDYNLTVNAYNYGTAVNTLQYDQTGGAGGNLSLDQRLLLKDDTNATGGELEGTLVWSAWDFNMTDGLSTRSGAASSEVAGVQFDNVGKVHLQVQDQNWAAVDINNPLDPTTADCDGAWICGGTTVTYIPHHFTLTGLTINDNNTSRNYTYVAELDPDDNTTYVMAARVQTTIEARNKGEGVTTNFKSGNLYYENPVAVTMIINDTDLGDANATKIDEALLGFGLDGDADGTKTITWDETNTSQVLRFNFSRDVDNPLNPFDINGTDLNITATSDYHPTDDTIGRVYGDENGTAAGTAHFYYGRSHAPRYRVEGNDGNLTIYYEVYCSTTADSAGRTCDVTTYGGGTPLANGILSVDDVRWFRNELHTVADDGNVTGVTGKTSIFDNELAKTNRGWPVWGFTYTGNKGYPFKGTVNMTTDPWLIYHRFDENATVNTFELEFNSATGGWTGVDRSNVAVDVNASTNTNRRIEW